MPSATTPRPRRRGASTPRAASSDGPARPPSSRASKGGAHVGSPDAAALPPLPLFDAVLAAWMAVFAVTALGFEPYLFLTDIGAPIPAGSWDVPRILWRWYAQTFDPVFLDLSRAFWLKVMCGLDFLLFGPSQIALLVALVRRRIDDTPWRMFAAAYACTITYTTIVYFAVEFVEEVPLHGADMFWVLLVNVPYTIVPLLVLGRVTIWHRADKG